MINFHCLALHSVSIADTCALSEMLLLSSKRLCGLTKSTITKSSWMFPLLLPLEPTECRLPCRGDSISGDSGGFTYWRNKNVRPKYPKTGIKIKSCGCEKLVFSWKTQSHGNAQIRQFTATDCWEGRIEKGWQFLPWGHYLLNQYSWEQTSQKECPNWP